MNDTTAAGAALHAALPVRAQIHLSRTAKFDHDAAQAFAQGWTLNRLVTRITSGQLGCNPAAVITTRLAECAHTPPPHTTGLAFCDRIQDVGPGAGMTCAELAGWIEDHNGSRTRRCPCRTRPPEATR